MRRPVGANYLTIILLLVAVSLWPQAAARQSAPAAAPVKSMPTRAAPVASATAPAFDAARFLEHVKLLSSDLYEGRLPGSKGEELTVRYVADQFKEAGLVPAMPDGSWFQSVALMGTTAELTPLTFRKGSNEQVLKPKDDFVAWTKRAVDSVALDNSELVFVGYGVEAPEFAWDDYKGVDLAGKTLVVLVGDPPVPDPNDALRLDPKVFAGVGMTYYGRWPYKFEMAAAKNAAGALIVHETAAAGYSFSVVQGRLGELFDLRAADNNMGRAAVEGWITTDRAKQLFALAGQDFEQLKLQAATRAFKPVPLGVTASVGIHNTLRPVDSRNVIGKIDGGDPRHRGECVIFTAHWDHLGTGPAIDGDIVRHGAVDNASGVAGLIELARAFGKNRAKPRRTLLFLAVTAEEQLFLGSEYYVRHPVVPLDRTLAVLNLEMLNVYGRTNDLIVYGLGASELDDYLKDAAAEQGRTIRPDATPEQGLYYRSDHFSFAKAGVPALWAAGGDDFPDRPSGYGRRVREEYIAARYHKPADVPRPDWDLAGALQDLQVYYVVASRIGSADHYPEWKPGTEFRARREQMMQRSARP